MFYNKQHDLNVITFYKYHLKKRKKQINKNIYIFFFFFFSYNNRK